MVLHHRTQSGKHVDRRWHKQRQNARETAFGLEEFSQEEITRYDLDTARITGDENPRTYTFRRAVDVFGVNGFDVRELRDR